MQLFLMWLASVYTPSGAQSQKENRMKHFIVAGPSGVMGIQGNQVEEQNKQKHERKNIRNWHT